MLPSAQVVPLAQPYATEARSQVRIRRDGFSHDIHTFIHAQEKSVHRVTPIALHRAV